MGFRGYLRKRETRTSIYDQMYEREKEKALVDARKRQAKYKMEEMRARARAEADRETAPRRSLARRIGSAASSGLTAADKHFNQPKRRAPRRGNIRRARPKTIYVDVKPRRRKKRKQKARPPGMFDFKAF